MWNKIKKPLRWLSGYFAAVSLPLAAMFHLITNDDDAETLAKNVQEQVKEYYSTPTKFLIESSKGDKKMLTKCYEEAKIAYTHGKIPHGSLDVVNFNGSIPEAYALSQIAIYFSTNTQDQKTKALTTCFKEVAKELEAEFEAEKTRALSVSLDARITQVEEGKFLEQRINYNFNAMAGFSSLLFLLTFAGRKEQKSAPKSEAVPKEPTL
ncbi:MAG TPA: hypothetical protein PLK94_11375 [Alphaproteobacteria bacterium]|nr:hypothetical protein [Alphaproteobacteria bacterium]HOO51878.1 hypothetical protein [Alphaproteobacteria bacterium]